ncbi:hypothetical protein [Proteus mirabilis]|uniref:hypothetical protein n=1 Tax=Proteus mirabilis TaxID=584 RepID=UPI0034D72275
MSKKFVFPLDRRSFRSKPELYAYIESNYSHLLSDDMPASRLYFNLKYNKTHGKSVISGKPTPWNEQTERYERFANEEERKKYRELFKERMKRKYGKIHLLNEPDQQKKMLNNRSISSVFTFSDGTTLNTNSTFEEKFLEYVDASYGLTGKSFSEPPTVYYFDPKLNRQAFYLPDFYIPSLNLIVEIKGSNRHYQERDKYREKLKSQSILKNGYDYVQINDSIYTNFDKYFILHVLEK